MKKRKKGSGEHFQRDNGILSLDLGGLATHIQLQYLFLNSFYVDEAHFAVQFNHPVFPFPFLDLYTQKRLPSSVEKSKDVMQGLGSITLRPSWLPGMSLEIVIMGTLVQSSLLLQDCYDHINWLLLNLIDLEPTQVTRKYNS